MVYWSPSAAAFQRVRPAKIKFYLRSMRQMGFDPARVLSGTDVQESTLEDPLTLVEIPDYIRIVSNMMELSRDPTLAFKLGDHLESGDLGVLGCAFSASQNAKQGMDIWHRYNRLFFGDLISVRRSPQAHMMHFEFIPQVPLLPHLLQFFMEEKIVVQTSLYGRFNNCFLEAKHFSLTYPRPEHGDLYDEYLQLDVEFNAERILYGIDYQDPNYSRPLKSANRELLGVCEAHLHKVATLADNQDKLSARVRQRLMESLPDVPLLSHLADEFNVSKRTFCRNLEAEHTSYKCLLAQVRKELCQNYLVTTTMSADKIALQLGFEDTGSLRKAFKQWTGITMKQYREQNRRVV